MKMRCILALCGTMAFVLAGCGSEIVESAVTETQVIDVNEPSAVEQAMESADYEFIDETQPLLDFEKEYENFRQQPLVADFLAAELALCRMMQDIFGDITEALDFE